ncbi:mannosyltransferase [Antrihabitans sp. YC3-6]|uniref:Mannosyltransferase n=1 Tax=Antrihabitans stalagmiti TaxID=2799499 RepID=A0A934NSZ8_9NOCA|nr:mannosyltransferase [Antrihabitans stalagmiti]MBJ8340881.1 mannosyltransferase [Antrihabitans stalagmiti]
MTAVEVEAALHTSAPSAPRTRLPLRTVAIILLTVSAATRLLWTALSANGLNLVDLRVYVDGSAALADNQLYEFSTSFGSPDFALPFTYPPFAALLFYPLHHLPFTVVGLAWQVATIGAMYLVVRISFELIDTALDDTAKGDKRPDRRNATMIWCAVALWTEPVRTTLECGQVNVFIVAAVLAAARSARWWISGALVGLVAGVKLTPAISGLYFLLRRRPATVGWSAVAFAATIGLSFALIGNQSRDYFTNLIGDATRIGPVGSVANQSLRGALSRLAGYDVGTGPAWLVGVAIAVVLAALAWRALAASDALGALLVVQFLGLVVSPISWAHHWVWVTPLLIWLSYGPMRHRRGARALAWYWFAATALGVPWALTLVQTSVWDISRPGVLAWLGAVNVIGVAAWFVWLGATRWTGVLSLRRVGRSPEPAPHPVR